MRTSQTFKVALLVVGLAGTALAQSAPLGSTERMYSSTASRAQVKAELSQARRAGTIFPDESGRTPAQEQSSAYPQQPKGHTATRADVKRDLDDARRSGTMIAVGSGRTFAEEQPSAFPHAVFAAHETRAHVKAELAEAVRDGDVPPGDAGTPAHQAPDRYMGARLKDGEAPYLPF